MEILFSQENEVARRIVGEDLLYDDKNVLVWQVPTTCIVLGRTQDAAKELYIDKVLQDEIPIYRRSGAGGAVVLDNCCICVALKYHKTTFNTDFYLKKSLSLIKNCLLKLNISCQIEKNYDLSINDRKVLGSSLYLSKDYALYYAVILISPSSLIAINKYLQMPSKKPKYRNERNHDNFITYLNDYTNLKQEELIAFITDYLQNNINDK